jgi:hypothetical protein
LEEEEWVNRVYKPFSTRKPIQKVFLERSAPPYTVRERYNTLSTLYGERLLGPTLDVLLSRSTIPSYVTITFKP